jgi:transposase-like protein
MSILSAPHFHDEAAAFAELEAILWPEGPVCPHCGGTDRIYALNGVRSKPSKKHPEGVERHGLKKCGQCKKQFTARVGTIFEGSHAPLHKWFQAIHLMCSSKKGISSHQLHRILEVQYNTAWFMSHRIREAMRSGNLLPPMGGAGEVVEVDETYIGNNGLYKAFKGARGFQHKHSVLTLVQRNGEARSFHVDRCTADNLVPVIRANIAKETAIATDEARYYKGIGKEFAAHGTVNHSAGEYGRGPIHTNTVEGYFSIFKRGMKGVYQHCSEKHLHRYLAEFDFRYSNRAALGVGDKERALKAVAGARGKRFTYRWSDVAQAN